MKIVHVLLILGLIGALLACGGSSSTTKPQAPVFSSTAPTSAQEGTAYTYDITATDPSGGTVSFALTSGPGTLSGSTLTWTPTHPQSRTANAFNVTATTSEGAKATQSWSVTPLGTIDGTYTGVNVDVSGTTYPQPPIDLSQWTINALVSDGSGGYTTYPGTGTSSGTFSIPGVPAGPYWLQTGTGYDQITTSDPVLGYYEKGRPNLTYPVTGVNLAFDVSGFASTDASEAYEWVAPNESSQYYYPAEGCWSADVSTGGVLTDTELWTNSCYSGANPLMDASQGDSGYFLAAPGCSYPDSYSSLCPVTYSFGPLAVSTPDGATTSINGAVTGVNGAVDVAVALSQFAALRPAINPNYQYPGYYFWAQPYLLENQYGSLMSPAEVLAYSSDNPATNDFDLGSQGFSDPFSESSTVLGYGFEDCVDVPYYASGTTYPAYIGVCTYASSTTAPSSGSPIAPGTGPVTNPMINGVSFFQNQTGISATPTISWSAPSGQSSVYAVFFWELVNYGGVASGLNWAGDLGMPATQGTSVTVPSGLLSGGSTYVAVIAADYDAAGCAGSGDTGLCTDSVNESFSYASSGTFTITGPASAHRRSSRTARPIFGMAAHLQQLQQRLQQQQQRIQKLTRNKNRGH